MPTYVLPLSIGFWDSALSEGDNAEAEDDSRDIPENATSTRIAVFCLFKVLAVRLSYLKLYFGLGSTHKLVRFFTNTHIRNSLDEIPKALKVVSHRISLFARTKSITGPSFMIVWNKLTLNGGNKLCPCFWILMGFAKRIPPDGCRVCEQSGCIETRIFIRQVSINVSQLYKIKVLFNLILPRVQNENVSCTTEDLRLVRLQVDRHRRSLVAGQKNIWDIHSYGYQCNN